MNISDLKRLTALIDANMAKRAIQFKQFRSDAPLPKYQSAGAGAFDVRAYWDGGKEGDKVYISPQATNAFYTGWVMVAPVGFGLLVLPRSGLASKRGLRPANTPGLIDSDYRGEAIVVLRNDSSDVQCVEYGDRIAQIMCVAAPQFCLMAVNEVDGTERGSGGFSSTGTK